jgi:hypothetical protein
MTYVITYSFAYIEGEITLCNECEESVNEAITLGPVSHGLHKGYCAACADRGAYDQGDN